MADQIPPQSPQQPQTIPVQPSADVQNANNFTKNNSRFVNQNPALAAEAINAKNPDTANTIAATATVGNTVNAVQNHLDTYNSHSWWQTALGDAKGIITGAMNVVNKVPVVSTLASWANKGLQEVQKDYKFISSVYQRHGIAEGILATIPVVAGGVIGSLAGPEGTAGGAVAGAALVGLGMDVGGAVERNIVGRTIPNYRDSLKDSDNPNYEADLGRQVAHGLAKIPGFQDLNNTNGGAGQVVSGVLDAAFDFKADPLANLGKLKVAVKEGKFLAQAVDETTGLPKVNDAGQPVMAASMRIAAQSDAVNNFFVSHSGVAYTSDQVQMAYNTQSAVKRAIDDLASRTNPVEIKKMYPQFTDTMARQLAKDDEAGKVISTLGQSLYSDELAGQDGYLPSLNLPTRTLGKNLVGNALEKIRTNSQATTLADTANFILPKKNLLFDAAGNAMKDANGNLQYETVKPALLGGGFMNALAGKVRTYTGMKALAFDPKLMKYSGKEINWADEDTSQAVFNVLYYSMPYKVALEHTAKIMAEPNWDVRTTMFHNAQIEAIKAAGIPADTVTFDKIVAEGRRALLGNEQKNGIWGYIKGTAIGKTLMKPDPTSKDPTANAEEHLASGGLFEHHAAGTAMLDYKSLRQAMRATKAYGALYNKFDDFYTNYTNLIFAPLTLLSMAFGFRVAASEALHQVIREGLGDYLKNRVIYSAASRRFDTDMVAKRVAQQAAEDAKKQGLPAPDKANELPREKITEADHVGIANAVAQQLDQVEHDRLADLANGKTTDEMLADNETMSKGRALAKQINDLKKSAIDLGINKDRLNDLATSAIQYKNRIAPVDWAAEKFVKIAPYSIKDKVDTLSKLWIDQGWKGLDAGVAAEHTSQSHLAEEDNVDMFAQVRGHGRKPGEQLHGMSANDPHYNKYLALNLTQMGNSAIARSIAQDFQRLSKQPGWDKLSADEQWGQVIQAHQARIEDPNQFKAARKILRVMDKGVPASVATNQVSALRGLVEGSDGTLHRDWLNNVAAGKGSFESDFKNVPVEQLPAQILGRMYRPNIKDVMQRVENFGFRTFVNPVMNFISREPMFGHFYYENYRKLAPLLADGRIDEGMAQNIAKQNAIKEMIPLIHNPQLRSQFSVMHRNILPFYFAQEQAMKRVGRLILSNPQAVRDFQMIHQGLNNPGFVHTDANGKKYIVYPLIGEFGQNAVRAMNAMGFTQFTGLPESTTGNTSSLLTVLPEMKVPSVGTFANIALTELDKRFPWMDKVVNAATGGYPATNFLDTVIPNSTVRDMFNALNFDQRESTVYNSMLSALAAAYYHGDLNLNGVPFSQLAPAEQQQLMDKVEANAKSNLMLKGLLSFFLPLSPSVSNDYYTKDEQTFGSEFTNMIKPTSQGGLGLTYAEAWSKFSAEHGQSAVSYTVTHSIDNKNGAKLPLSDSTLAWINNNQDLMKEYSNGAAYLIPQPGLANASSPDAVKVEQKLLTMQLRSKMTPQQFLNAVYIQQGWNDIQPNYVNYQNYVNNARAQGNRFAVSQAVNAWNNYTQNYGLQNPIWYEDYSGKSKVVNADLALRDLLKMQDKGIMKDPQYAKINDLVNNYRNFDATYQQYKVNGTSSSLATSVRDAWITYCDTLEKSDPTLTSIINGVFRRVV